MFDRTARGIAIDAGRRWIERFEIVLAELRCISNDISALQGVVQGVVTIGALPLARLQLPPQAIAAVLPRHPKLQIRSLESPYGELTANLLSGRIDFIVGALHEESDDAFLSRTLLEDKIALCIRNGHPLVHRKRLRLADLVAFPWVLSRAGIPLRDSLELFCHNHGAAAPVSAVETGDLALLRGLLVSSDMLTALSAHQLHYEVIASQLVVLPFPMPGMERRIGVTTRRGAHLSPGANALLAEIDKVSGQWR